MSRIDKLIGILEDRQKSIEAEIDRLWPHRDVCSSEITRLRFEVLGPIRIELNHARSLRNEKG